MTNTRAVMRWLGCLVIGAMLVTGCDFFEQKIGVDDLPLEPPVPTLDRPPADWTPPPTEDPFERHICQDDLNDVEAAHIDLGEFSVAYDPFEAALQFAGEFPRTPDLAQAVAQDPNWVFVIPFGDVPGLTGFGIYGLGQCHLGCYTYMQEFECKWYYRMDDGYVSMRDAVSVPHFEAQRLVIDAEIPGSCPYADFGVAVQGTGGEDQCGVENGRPNIPWPFEDSGH